MDSIHVEFETTCDFNIKIVENFFQFLKRADWRFPVVDGAYRQPYFAAGNKPRSTAQSHMTEAQIYHHTNNSKHF